MSTIETCHQLTKIKHDSQVVYKIKCLYTKLWSNCLNGNNYQITFKHFDRQAMQSIFYFPINHQNLAMNCLNNVGREKNVECFTFIPNYSIPSQ